jgi:hypothetical protein
MAPASQIIQTNLVICSGSYGSYVQLAFRFRIHIASSKFLSRYGARCDILPQYFLRNRLVKLNHYHVNVKPLTSTVDLACFANSDIAFLAYGLNVQIVARSAAK